MASRTAETLNALRRTFVGKDRRNGRAGRGLVAVTLFTLLAYMTGIGIEPAHADDRCLAFSASLAGDAKQVKLVLDFDCKPDVAIHYVDKPRRILVDFSDTVLGFPEKSLVPTGLVTRLRAGAMGPHRARIVLQTDEPARAHLESVKANGGGAGYRATFDVTPVSASQFSDLLSSQNWREAETGGVDAAKGKTTSGNASAFTVVIDPGHGGIDGGAVGVDETAEKTVTLAFAKKLAADLGGHDLHVVLTRDDDTFVSLADRVKIARENDADLFVSIHADSISVKSLRGATVYTLSDNASDRLANQIAQSENRADAVAGLKVGSEPKAVAGILADLTRRETRRFSGRLSDSVISAFTGDVDLINNPQRHAGFRVLEAPDVPSVLVELGFLSNPDDEKQLIDPQWRAKVAGLMTKAILAYRDKVSPESR
ncbi:N-acetylmuramoyl-L-alanine amidase [Pararhizobium mangrovi]|nr:N-acetylmuramoyl-L-alanine amidase [Pararhizobium mangrovi]